jgi:hypothetical protein
MKYRCSINCGSWMFIMSVCYAGVSCCQCSYVRDLLFEAFEVISGCGTVSFQTLLCLLFLSFLPPPPKKSTYMGERPSDQSLMVACPTSPSFKNLTKKWNFRNFTCHFPNGARRYSHPYEISGGEPMNQLRSGNLKFRVHSWGDFSNSLRPGLKKIAQKWISAHLILWGGGVSRSSFGQGLQPCMKCSHLSCTLVGSFPIAFPQNSNVIPWMKIGQEKWYEGRPLPPLSGGCFIFSPPPPKAPPPPVINKLAPHLISWGGGLAGTGNFLVIFLKKKR